MGVSGLSVAGRLEGGKGTCGYGYMSGFIGWVYRYMVKHTHARKVHISLLDPDTLFYFYSQVDTL